jgi:hypothetical protein
MEAVQRELGNGFQDEDAAGARIAADRKYP